MRLDAPIESESGVQVWVRQVHPARVLGTPVLESGAAAGKAQGCGGRLVRRAAAGRAHRLPARLAAQAGSVGDQEDQRDHEQDQQ